ncbi:hypothetical protein QQY66_21120 [Streptomyces sp. DG2A-72]|uniref:hypothetical protein n=1 Tax=Streptomyces sp. DG2A-72 TaxID=3051386 RepID=UPI00265C1AAC|nr:hypothetical protein [Streptomyces sp. DG2A-72]MDO0934069.1 hypothetical protein [Streptomyces sp. DG2A-72]
MRIRTTVAAVTGALALSALVVPAAQAADAPASGKLPLSTAGSTAAAAELDVTFSNMQVNKGKSIVVGTTAQVAVPVTYTLTHAADLDTSADNFASGPLIYRGTSVESATNVLISDDPGTCTAASSTVLNCSAVINIRPADGELSSSEAGTWKAGGLAVTADEDTKWQGDLGTRKVLRAAKLTVNAAPEPVLKGKTITVTGKLSRANWDTNTYAGYANQKVVLQFRKAGTTNYTNVKGITSTSTGTLKTTVTASTDGYYRFTFAGSPTTAPTAVAGDYVDVQ